MVQISETPRNSSRTFIADSSEDEYESLPESHPLIGLYDKPLPCFGCGMGWVMVVLGLVFPPLWYCGALLYLTNYYDYDPRERSGLAAAAIMKVSLLGNELEDSCACYFGINGLKNNRRLKYMSQHLCTTGSTKKVLLLSHELERQKTAFFGSGVLWGISTD
ncbi:hypothetical protein KP509_38G036600 [Ceratopteris richardii]|uniref:Uncharacterized protein n=1 Tax=Ceratopteris richardii TaxID=49495 RepID=A0A8T2Q3T5_CERRI|nr:hypothetical protein KP509_38G036600 [Ceratopteris richardii]